MRFNLDLGVQAKKVYEYIVHQVNALIVLSRIVPVNGYFTKVWGLHEDTNYKNGSLTKERWKHGVCSRPGRIEAKSYPRQM